MLLLSCSACYSGFHLFRHSFSTAFSLAIMALSSSSSTSGGAAPKGLVIRSVQILNGGVNDHESCLLLLVRKVLSEAQISSSSSGETSGFKGHESRLLLLVRKVVSTIGHKSRLLLLIPNSNRNSKRQSEYLLANRGRERQSKYRLAGR